MSPIQTALGRLLQERRESAGYSRTRIGELVGIKPGTIEGWELGRVTRPPIHDVLRIAHFLRIPADEIQRAVFADLEELVEALAACAQQVPLGHGAVGERQCPRVGRLPAELVQRRGDLVAGRAVLDDEVRDRPRPSGR